MPFPVGGTTRLSPIADAQSDLSNAEIANYRGGLSVSGPRALPTPRQSAESVVQSLARYQASESQISILQFPLDRPKYYFLMQFSAYSRPNLFDVQTQLNTNQHIVLPVPLGINDQHAVTYDEKPIGAFTGSMFNAGLPPIQNLIRGEGSFWPDVPKAMTRGGVQGTVGSVTSSPLISAATGYTPNQFFVVLLEGPQYKKLQFNWHLVPRSFEESVRIKDIVRVLNNAMSPGLTLGGSIFSFPLVVQCAFMPNYPWLFRFKPAVIESLNVNYTPANIAAFYHEGDGDGLDDNPPESVQIQILFHELEYWLLNDFKDIDAAADDTSGGPDRYVPGGILASVSGWATRVLTGSMTLDDVPAAWRDTVRQLSDNLRDNDPRFWKNSLDPKATRR